jgi:uncharacterized membrane protein
MVFNCKGMFTFVPACYRKSLTENVTPRVVLLGRGCMPFLYIALGTFMWSLDTLIRYPLLASVRPDTMVFIEHSFLVLYFLPLLFINKFDFKKINRSAILGFVVIGMLGSAASTLAFTKAFSLINPSLVILLQKLQPLVVILLSAALLKKKSAKTFSPSVL